MSEDSGKQESNISQEIKKILEERILEDSKMQEISESKEGKRIMVEREDMAFTVDRERMIQTLQRSRLADPHAYIKDLIVGLVSTDAKDISIRGSQQKITLTGDGKGIPLQSLDEKLSLIFTEGEMDELAAGILSSFDAGARQVLLETVPEGEEPYQLIISQQEGLLDVSEPMTLEKKLKQGTRITVKKEKTNWKYVLTKQPLGSLILTKGVQELGYAVAACANSSLQVRINGRKIKRKHLPEICTPQVKIENVPYVTGWVGFTDNPSFYISGHWGDERESNSQRSTIYHCSKSIFRIFRKGLFHGTWENESTEISPLYAELDCSKLRVDISGEKLMKDEKINTILKTVISEAVPKLYAQVLEMKDTELRRKHLLHYTAMNLHLLARVWVTEDEQKIREEEKLEERKNEEGKLQERKNEEEKRQERKHEEKTLDVENFPNLKEYAGKIQEQLQQYEKELQQESVNIDFQKKIKQIQEELKQNSADINLKKKIQQLQEELQHKLADIDLKKEIEVRLASLRIRTDRVFLPENVQAELAPLHQAALKEPLYYLDDGQTVSLSYLFTAVENEEKKIFFDARGYGYEKINLEKAILLKPPGKQFSDISEAVVARFSDGFKIEEHTPFERWKYRRFGNTENHERREKTLEKLADTLRFPLLYRPLQGVVYANGILFPDGVSKEGKIDLELIISGTVALTIGAPLIYPLGIGIGTAVGAVETGAMIVAPAVPYLQRGGEKYLVKPLSIALPAVKYGAVVTAGAIGTVIAAPFLLMGAGAKTLWSIIANIDEKQRKKQQQKKEERRLAENKKLENLPFGFDYFKKRFRPYALRLQETFSSLDFHNFFLQGEQGEQEESLLSEENNEENLQEVSEEKNEENLQGLSEEKNEDSLQEVSEDKEEEGISLQKNVSLEKCVKSLVRVNVIPLFMATADGSQIQEGMVKSDAHSFKYYLHPYSGEKVAVHVPYQINFIADFNRRCKSFTKLVGSFTSLAGKAKTYLELYILSVIAYDRDMLSAYQNISLKERCQEYLQQTVNQYQQGDAIAFRERYQRLSEQLKLQVLPDILELPRQPTIDAYLEEENAPLLQQASRILTKKMREKKC